MPQACLSVGVEYREVPSDNRFHAVPLADGSDKTAGRIKYFPTGGGMVFNWRTSEQAYYFPESNHKLTRDQIEAQRLKNQQVLKEEQNKERRRFRLAQKKALEIWDKAKAATADNPYLKRKHAAPQGELKALPLSEIEQCLNYSLKGGKGRFKDGEILIAPRRIHGEITTLEFIAGDGNKHYLLNGRLSGAYWISNSKINKYGLNEKIGICEGVATALSVADKAEITAVSVGGCTNFDACIQAVKDTYPEAEIVILADAGRGEEKAKECAEKYGLVCRAPSFTPDQIEVFKNTYGAEKEPTDFNDLMLIDMIEALP
jgi:putative DNA primase/helicase